MPSGRAEPKTSLAVVSQYRLSVRNEAEIQMSYPRHRTSTGQPVVVTPTPHLPDLEQDTLACWLA